MTGRGYGGHCCQNKGPLLRSGAAEPGPAGRVEWSVLLCWQTPHPVSENEDSASPTVLETVYFSPSRSLATHPTQPFLTTHLQLCDASFAGFGETEGRREENEKRERKLYSLCLLFSAFYDVLTSWCLTNPRRDGSSQGCLIPRANKQLLFQHTFDTQTDQFKDHMPIRLLSGSCSPTFDLPA